MTNVTSNASSPLPTLARWETLTARFGHANSVSPCDHILHETADYYVTPCLGSIVPDWLIVWPKTYALNGIEWLGSTKRISAVVSEISHILGVEQDDHVIWFEHGCQEFGSATGCGVNFAHLHMLLRPQFDINEFREEVQRASRLEWAGVKSRTSADDFGALDYHIFGDGSMELMTNDSSHLGSQFFRRVIAKLVDDENGWDYNRFPNEQNARQTLLNLGVRSSN